MRRAAALAAVLAVLSAGCGDAPAHAPAAAPQAAAGSAVQFDAATIEHAVAYMHTHPAGGLRPGWLPVVAAATSTSGPADETRWHVVAVHRDGTVDVWESFNGESGALNLLIQPGDYFYAHPQFGGLSTTDVKLVEKAAVSVGDR